MSAPLEGHVTADGASVREQAELQVYLAKLNETVQEMRAILKEYRR